MVAGLLLTASIIAATPLTALAACGPNLDLVDVPSGVKSVNAIAAVATDDVWGVGTATGSPDRTVATHWDGNAWSVVPTATQGQGDEGFNGVAAVAANNVWAVGYALIGGGYQTMIQHWNGGSWSISPSPSIGSANNALIDVAAVGPNDVWAVGYTGTPTQRLPLVEHWNGSSWSVVSVPKGGSKSNALLSVTAISSNNVWAVGYSSKGLGFKTFVVQWDGSAWVTRTSANVGTLDNVLTGVAASSPTAVWAVGYAMDGNVTEPIIQKFNGVKKFVQVSAPSIPSAASILRDVAVTNSGTAWAAGLRYDAAVGDNQTLGERFDGTSWSTIVTPNRSRSTFASVGIVPGTNEVWMGGRTGVMAHACPGPGGGPPPLAGITKQLDGAGGSGSSAGAGSGAKKALATRTVPSQLAAPISVTAQDVAASAGIAETTKTFGAAVGDANDDSYPDIVLGRHQVHAHFYLNDQASGFTEPFPNAFPDLDRHRCAWMDVNHDNRLDVICVVGADAGTDFKQNELWIQQPNGSFVNEADQYGVMDPTGRGRIPVPLDANHDGWTDVLITNRHVRADGLPTPDHLFLNQGGTSFLDAPSFGLDLDLGIQASCASSADINNDGFDDVIVCRPSSVKLFENVNGTSFRDVTTAWAAKGNAEDAILQDMNDDGKVDEVVALGSRVEVRLQSGGKFQPAAYSFSTTAAVGLAAGDVNADGLQDLYVLRGDNGKENAPDRFLINDGDGTSFTQMTIPTTSAGTADVVVPLDFDQNGLTDFLVLNRLTPNIPGPVQLIAFFPSP